MGLAFRRQAMSVVVLLVSGTDGLSVGFIPKVSRHLTQSHGEDATACQVDTDIPNLGQLTVSKQCSSVVSRRSAILSASIATMAFFSDRAEAASTLSIPAIQSASLKSSPSVEMLSISLTQLQPNSVTSLGIVRNDNFLRKASSSDSSSSFPSSSSSWEESLSGFFAGATMSGVKTIVKYPLDTATVRLQLRDQQGAGYSLENLSELFRGSFNGVTTALVANIPAGAVFFAVRDAAKANLRGNPFTSEWPSWIRTCLSVAVAQPPYWLVRNPSEIVKTRQQANRPGYMEGNSMLQSYKQVLADASKQSDHEDKNVSLVSTLSDWIGAFYLGYWENIAYAYPADVIKFLVYDQWTEKLGGKKNLTPVQGAIAGSVSTAIAQFITTPLDVVRNRLMASTATKASTVQTTNQISSTQIDELLSTATTDDSITSTGEKGHQHPELMEATRTATPIASQQPQKLLSYWEALSNLAATEGMSGLFAGATPRVSKAIVSGAIQFAAYEETKRDIAKFLQNYYLLPTAAR